MLFWSQSCRADLCNTGSALQSFSRFSFGVLAPSRGKKIVGRSSVQSADFWLLLPFLVCLRPHPHPPPHPPTPGVTSLHMAFLPVNSHIPPNFLWDLPSAGCFSPTQRRIRGYQRQLNQVPEQQQPRRGSAEENWGISWQQRGAMHLCEYAVIPAVNWCPTLAAPASQYFFSKRLKPSQPEQQVAAAAKKWNG